MSETKSGTVLNFKRLFCSVCVTKAVPTIICACIFLSVLSCTTSDTPDWTDEEEDDAFEKDLAIDELTIVDYSHFYSQYGRRMMAGTKLVSNVTGERLLESDRDTFSVFDYEATNNRYKREVLEYSGGDPCEDGPQPCKGPGEICIFNTSSSTGYHCECGPGYDENVATSLSCSEIPESRRVYVTTPLDTPKFDPDLNNNSSDTFLDFRSKCEIAFTHLFKEGSGFLTLRTLEFRSDNSRRTVVVNVLYFKTHVTSAALVDVAKAVLDMENYGRIVINGTMYSITHDTGIFLTYSGSSTVNDDVDWCSEPSLYSCSGGKICLDAGLRYRCECKVGFVELDGQCLDANEFQYDLYPYGSSNGDTLLPEGDDEVVRVDVSAGIPYTDSVQHFFYVGINGLITFGDQRDSGLSVQLYGHLKMFSPYQADIITRNENGHIWYRIYSRRNQAKEVFEKVDREVIEFMELKKFKAKLVIVITWDRVSHYSKRNAENRVTFQTIFASDGEMSYALVYYKNDSMLWDPRVTNRVVMGYSDGKSRPDSIRQLHFSYTSVAITGMGNLLGNTGKKGTWAYKVGEKLSPDQICDDWYETYLSNIDFYNSLNTWIPECPCNFNHLSPRWIYNRNIPEANADCYTIEYSSGWTFFPHGRECCYILTRGLWTWVQDMPYAGSLLLYNPVYTWNLPLHKEQDRDPHDACCSLTSTIASCRKYYTLRPNRLCTSSASSPGWSWGDPHILTLDGKNYTFNGWGEYTMLKIEAENVTFALQARTERAQTENGSMTDATIFSAFAMEENGHRVFVRLDPNDNQSLVIYANGTDHSRSFRQQMNFTVPTAQFSLRRNNNSLIVLFSASGIGITIAPGVQALDISVDVPLSYRQKTTGLLGNYNGDPSDDFILPNGTVLPENISDREKFYNFGVYWAIVHTESLFLYDQRLGPANYSHPDFEPIFLDEVGQTDTASKECGGSDKLACIYDFLVTGSKELAAATKKFEETASIVNAENRNTVPELNDTDMVNATQNSVVVFQLIGEDKDNDSFTYHLADNTAGNVSVNASGLVTYNPSITEPAYLSFYVVDSKNAASPAIVVPVVFCSGCSGQGVCDYNNLRNGSTRTFQIASCICSPARTGEDCDQHRDACLENPCFAGQNCTDLTPGEQGNSTIGYNCSDCPAGYEANTTTNKCQDIDECLPPNVCQQNCNNTEGSFLCSCNQGYRLRVDGKSCIDINECAEKTHNCQQICFNYPGSFNCSCYPGYTYHELNNTCIQDPYTAGNCSNFNCSQRCGMVDGNPECFCLQGYTLTSDNKTCQDINECALSICNQVCNNTPGSFTCSCYVGYHLDTDRTTCNECPALHYGPDCSQVCNCNGRGTGCDKVTGCRCESGWKGTYCEQDIDECQETPNICRNVREVCVNTKGSYTCDCQTGYTRGTSQTCTDVNECDPFSGLNTCGSLQDCVNTVGSFFCTCKTGYQAVNGNSNCTDIDECNGSHLCEQRCINTDGSYNCECNYGYRLKLDRFSCAKVEDPCKDEENLHCLHGCTLLDNNTAVCFCSSGYRLGPDFQSCNDIDECTSQNSGCSHTCKNTPGSFQCSCPVGFFMGNDRKKCFVCGAGTYGEDCANDCACGIGAARCDSVSGCVCTSGWAGSKCDQDIDECQVLSVVQECQTKNATCTNFQGGYRCDCETGYEWKNFNETCEDINECLASPCSQICENFPGGYQCLCNEGFTRLPNGTCQDVDECALPVTNRCQQECINTIGSYRCYCNQTGYELSNDGYSCTARITCNESTTCPSLNGGCSVLNGTDNCFCNSGYDYNITNNNCTEQVINWCDKAGCEDNCTQITEFPRFQCQCRDGYLLNNDGKTCRPCVAGTYGKNCSSPCTCAAQNTISCSNTDGNCTCKEGWRGNNCTQDVDECVEGPPSCVANSNCFNTNGSYLCVCSDGYHKLADGNCTECTGNSYGDNCGSQCKCNATNTVSCHHITGNCICKQGWTGSTCDDDVDECSNNTHNCSGQQEVCSNTIGGYDCVCEEGYHHNASNACVECAAYTYGANCRLDCQCIYTNTESCHHVNGTCNCREGWEGDKCEVDIDECLRNTHNCSGLHEMCNNTGGGYECICMEGYLKNDSNRCTECTGNTYGVNCGSRCQCNVTNTVSCHHVTGNCFCKQEWTGPTCDDDVDECSKDTHNCSAQHEVCSNTIGGYDCVCEDGYQHNASIVCVECTGYTYGANCRHDCQCVFANIKSCHHVNGTCMCREGWEGDKCEVDIDECLRNTHNCSGQHEMCNNTDGGYECVCVEGYLNNASNVCTECTGNSYGVNCGTRCQCNVTNTVSCHHVTGNCSCKREWTGPTCDDDVDECSDNRHNCSGQHEVCSNTIGGYDCVCEDGYWRNASNVCFEEIQKISFEMKLSGNFSYSEEELENVSSVTFKILSADIVRELWDHLKEVNDTIRDITIIALRQGSIIPTGEMTLTDLTVTAKSKVAYAMVRILSAEFNISGTVAQVGSLTLNNKTIGDVCDALDSIEGCGPDTICSIASGGYPTCEPIPTDLNLPLVIGLAVGIPLFVVIIAVIAFFVYRRFRRKSTGGSSILDDNQSEFSKIFSRRLPLFGVLGHRGLYKPDSSTEISDEDNQLDRYRTHSSDHGYTDSSSCTSGRLKGSRRLDAKEPASFSWDQFYQTVVPEEEFHIERPKVSASPNPTYQISVNTPSLDEA